MNKGDVVYYARVIPSCNTYEVLELKVRTVEEDWFVGTEKDTQQAYLFAMNLLGKYIFQNREDALNTVIDAEESIPKEE